MVNTQSTTPQRTKAEYRRPWIYPKQAQAIFGPDRYAVVEASTKSGKAQPLSARVYTPAGPVSMGNVTPGMTVLTPQGAAQVVGVYPQSEQQIYRVTFSDGSSTTCTPDHLWEVHADRRDYRRGLHYRDQAQPNTRVRRRDALGWPRVLTLDQIAAYAPREFRRMWIPVTDPVPFPAQPVPLDPYLVGLLIGDGGLTTESIRFSSTDEELIEAIRALCGDYYDVHYSGHGCDYTIRTLTPYQRIPQAEHIGRQLRDLGLWGCHSYEKFVPECYRYNTMDVRLSLLQGIMDTDGWVNKAGQPYLTQTSPRLAEQVAEIVESLGGITRTTPKKTAGRLAYNTRITIADPAQLFRLKRKRESCRPKRREVKRTFRSIAYAGKEHAQCIELDDPRGLYLTDRFIVTHNTVGCMIWLNEQAFHGKPGSNYWWVAPTNAVAKIAFRRNKRSLPKGFYTSNDTEQTITLLNGTTIWYKTGDKPDSLYGEDVYAAVIDEASRVKEESWPAVRSTLTATRGPIRIIGNVKGKKNWAYNLARRAEAGEPGMHYERITAYDAVEAGVLAAEEIEDARRNLTESVFRELYEAIAAADDTNPFNEDYIDRCTLHRLAEGPPVAFGIDLAKKVDWTVVIGLNASGQVCHFDRWQAPWEQTYSRIKAAVQQVPGYVDSTGVGDPVFEWLAPSTSLESFVFSSRSKQQVMEGLAVAIQHEEISFPEGPITLELKSFEYQYTRTGVRYSAPEGFHDDCVTALGLATLMWHDRPPTYASVAGGSRGSWGLPRGPQTSPVPVGAQVAGLGVAGAARKTVSYGRGLIRKVIG